MSQQQLVDFKTTLVDLVDGAMDPGAHPDAEDLRRFRAGELSEEDAERLREHLLCCRECVAQLRSPESFADRDPKSDFEIAAFWRGLRPGLEASSVSPASSLSRGERGPGGHRPVYALAASLAVGLLGLGLWSVMQSRTIATLSAPRPNATIYDVSATEARGSGAEKPLEIPAGKGFFLVLIPKISDHATYGLKIRDAAGNLVHHVQGLEKNPADDTFTVWMPSGAVEAGEYRLELHGNDDKGGDTILERRLTLRDPHG